MEKESPETHGKSLSAMDQMFELFVKKTAFTSPSPSPDNSPDMKELD